MKHAGLILAGGKSERFSEKTIQKQFTPVAGKPLMLYAVTVFQKCPAIDSITIVAPNEWFGRIEEWINLYEISKFFQFAEAGETRQHSIFNGLKAVKELSPDKIIIHDAARPNVLVNDIEDCISASIRYDGATPVLTVNDTVYQSEDGLTISATLNRDTLFAGQTPECYDYIKYLAAHEDYYPDLANFRGSSEIAVKAGMVIAMAKGNIGNFKVTTKEDLERFEQIKGL